MRKLIINKPFIAATLPWLIRRAGKTPPQRTDRR
jgi:hypothetical protein